MSFVISNKWCRYETDVLVSKRPIFQSLTSQQISSSSCQGQISCSDISNWVVNKSFKLEREKQFAA